MAEGWVIFREPQSGITEGWKGQFEVYRTGMECEDTAFYVKPWETTVPAQVLLNAERQTDPAVFLPWIREVKPGITSKSEDTGFEDFENYIRFIKTGILQGDFEKVVASRTSTVSTSIDAESVYLEICAAYPDSFAYLLYHPKLGFWMGASPEKFTFVTDGTGSMNAVAGTVFQAAQGWTSKEKKEQTVIEKYLVELLDERGIQGHSFSETRVIDQGPISHLASEISFKMEEDLTGFLRAAHPTPAVGGYPKQQALMFIERFENFDRELYAGWLGMSSENTFKSWVNIRCARIYEDSVRLFAGCGINAQSDPQMEWEETEAKLNILGKYIK